MGTKEKYKSLEQSPKRNEWENAPSWIKSPKEKYAYHGYLNTFSHNINLVRYLCRTRCQILILRRLIKKASLVILN